ncbi:MAG TPA: DJ-1/PfpI family protein [Capillimicrobium sp.]|jgi:transcriptional regulator GlxA family with amidase domain
MQIAIPVFDGITALDAVGPYEVLARIPGAEVLWVAPERRPHVADRGLTISSTATLDEVRSPDVVVVPGGEGNRALMRDELFLAWLRAAHERTRWTTSVCTGALVLGAAGILDGVRATTHWGYVDELAALGAIAVSDERVVEEGKILTAAGVSAGIDMALALVARLTVPEVAQAIQLGIEYDPQPPYDTGSVAKAGPELAALVRSVGFD